MSGRLSYAEALQILESNAIPESSFLDTEEAEAIEKAMEAIKCLVENFNKLWKARITTHDGESEYGDDILIRGANNQKEAIEEARWQARHWYSGDAEPCQGYEDMWEEVAGYRIIELEGVSQIQSLDELMQSFYIVDCQQRVSK